MRIKDFIWEVDIFWLMEGMVVVKLKGEKVGLEVVLIFVKHKIRPRVNNLVYELDREVARN